MSCSSSEGDVSSDQNEEQALTDSISNEAVFVEFTTPIRPDQQMWDLSQKYTDTLLFEYFDDNYDYWYAFFTSNMGENIAMACDDPIADDLGGSRLKVVWEVDSLYEAGEGDELYYKERLLSYEVVERGNRFSAFLREFIKAYSRDSDDLIGNYIHPELGFTDSYHPGAACMGKLSAKPKVSKFISWDCVISDKMPKGDFCEGYPNVEDGLYFEKITEDELPTYAYPETDDFEIRKLELPADYKGSELKKVTIIKDEFHARYLYFVKVYQDWFLLSENVCDCSA